MRGSFVTTRDIAEDLVRRMGDGDFGRIADLFAVRSDWKFNWPVEGHPSVPWIRPRSSRDDVAEHFRSLDAYHVAEENGTSVTRILVDGDDAVVLGDIVQTVR